MISLDNLRQTNNTAGLDAPWLVACANSVGPSHSRISCAQRNLEPPHQHLSLFHPNTNPHKPLLDTITRCPFQFIKVRQNRIWTRECEVRAETWTLLTR